MSGSLSGAMSGSLSGASSRSLRTSAGSPGRSSSAQAREPRNVLRDALAAEHAAIWAYGLAEAHLTGDRRALAQQSLAAHRERREEVIPMLLATSAEPLASLPAYTLPFPVAVAADAQRLAAYVEEGLARAWADVVGGGPKDLRRFAAGCLQDAAVRAAAWRGTTIAFPGLPERH